MRSRRFRATILDGHKGAAVEVPFDPATELGTSLEAIRPGRRGHPVAATLDQVRFESHVVARSSRFWLLIDADVLDKAGRSVGDTAEFGVGKRAATAT